MSIEETRARIRASMDARGMTSPLLSSLPDLLAEELERDPEPLAILEHDPEHGCGPCPIVESEPVTLRSYCPALVEEVDPAEAPPECPLREGSVLVRAPRREP